MCGQPTAYNTYATLSYTNPLFLDFSCSQNVNKEIISHRCVFTPQTLVWGVFFNKKNKYDTKNDKVLLIVHPYVLGL